MEHRSQQSRIFLDYCTICAHNILHYCSHVHENRMHIVEATEKRTRCVQLCSGELGKTDAELKGRLKI